jgi:hypothetical protein
MQIRNVDSDALMCNYVTCFGFENVNDGCWLLNDSQVKG